jgi:hypothetical protein
MMHSAAAADNQIEAKLRTPLAIFCERAEARALLVANGAMSMHDAVDVMQETAAAQGLVAEHGQDEIQRILGAAFAGVHS